jgi:predicted nuclease of predicted toxin-antitoxin system
MKFLCDVHISYKLCKFLESKDFECIHINKVLEKWHTPDNIICQYADANDFVVITKDEDFRNSHIFRNTPKKLIRIILGNISNKLMLDLFDEYLPLIQSLENEQSFFVEIGSSFVIYPD